MIAILLIGLLFLESRISVAFSNGLIDPKTDKLNHARKIDGKMLRLVMSDEFEEEGRRFEKGYDKFFESIDQPDLTNQAMQYYNSSIEYVTTRSGKLVISTKAVKTSWDEWDSGSNEVVHRTRNYTSGMVQSWNKFCFTGGVLELSIKLPGGNANAGGLWPAAWMMGNLARATFPASTMDIWPWSYDHCGEMSHLAEKQQINACEAAPGHGLRPNQGRGSPEIDIFEVMLGHSMPGQDQPLPAFMSSSLQISPGIKKDKRPKNGHKLNQSFVWYDGIRMSPQGEFNFGFWGQECGPEKDSSAERVHKYMEDAISVNTDLDDTHFQSQHVYRVEWQPGEGGYLEWYLDDNFIMGIDAHTLNLTGASIPKEPMYLVLNTAVSHSWGFPEPCDKDACGVCYHCYDCTNPECQCTLPDGMKDCKNLPAHMEIDYIRLYQDESDASHTVDCSPDEFPTAQFIADFADRYADWKPLSSHGELELLQEHQTGPTRQIMRLDHAIMIMLAAAIALAVLCLGLYMRTLWRSVQIFIVRRRIHHTAYRSPATVGRGVGSVLMAGEEEHQIEHGDGRADASHSAPNERTRLL